MTGGGTVAGPTTTAGLTTAAVRFLLGSVQWRAGRSETVAAQLERAIRLGLVKDGERLPPEARLAAQLGVAPLTLREALAALRAQGLVVTRRGRGGGTFAQISADRLGQDGAERLRRWSVNDLRDLGDHRSAIAGAAASLAAARADAAEIGGLHRHVERLALAETADRRRQIDAQLAVAIAAASQSARLTREQLAVDAEIGDLLTGRSADTELVDLRRLMVGAIEAGAGVEARLRAEQHVARQTSDLIARRITAYRSATEPAGQAAR